MTLSGGCSCAEAGGHGGGEVGGKRWEGCHCRGEVTAGVSLRGHKPQQGDVPKVLPGAQDPDQLLLPGHPLGHLHLGQDGTGVRGCWGGVGVCAQGTALSPATVGVSLVRG